MKIDRTHCKVTPRTHPKKGKEMLNQSIFVSEEQKVVKELQQLILSQEKTLQNKSNQVNAIVAQIERTEAQLNRWNTKNENYSDKSVSDAVYHINHSSCFKTCES